MLTQIAPSVYIGDRVAQMCALVLNADLAYTTDRADPFAVQRLIERYLEDLATYSPNKRSYLTAYRRIFLSTGLMWAPRYDGMVAKQLNTLFQDAFITPLIYVMPVSTSVLLGHALNHKLAAVCASSQMRRDSARYLGAYWQYAGTPRDPTTPTPVEVLALHEAFSDHTLPW